VTKADEPTVHDLRDIPPPATANPKSPKEPPTQITPLVEVGQPHLVTPGIGSVPEGQTTHE
jgi:hypothetical protein